MTITHPSTDRASTEPVSSDAPRVDGRSGPPPPGATTSGAAGIGVTARPGRPVALLPPAVVARRSRRVEPDDIALFTEISGDRNPVHYDPVLARASRFGEIIVQGGVTTALLNAVVAEQLPGPGSVFLETRWSYRAPVRPGDVITAEVEVLSTRVDKPISRLRTTITDQDGRTVLDGEATVWRDPVVAAATGWSAGLGPLGT